MQTMLITIPEITNDGVNCEIIVKPKISLTVTNSENDIIKLDINNSAIKLPQTGVLNWPIMVLTVAGFILFGISWIVLYFKKNKVQKILTGIAIVMITAAVVMQINNEIYNAKLNRQSVQVIEQIQESIDNHLVDENSEKTKKMEINGITYIGVLSIPSLNNMSLRSN